MQDHAKVQKKSTVDIGLGYYEDIKDLFYFGDGGPDLLDAITFVFSQTLQRDLFYGSWAQAYQNGDGEFRVKMSSPKDDVSPYQKLVPEYIKAGKLAVQSYYKKVPYSARKNWEFLMPFGLAMANVKSIQLLHFPPTETFTYRDYLYSPTNRRWECLLSQNGFEGSDNTLVERIIDVAPIAAPGDAGKELEDFNQDFVPYVQAQLNNFLSPLAETGHEITQPIVAYGGPVHTWLKEAFDLPKTPRTLEIVKLQIKQTSEGQNAPFSWVLCANHPSEYLYDTSIPLRDSTKPVGDYPAPITVMCQDLVAAGWQAHMSRYPGDDPYKTLSDMEARWGWDAKNRKVKEEKVSDILAIMKEQDDEFSYGVDSFTPTQAQTKATAFAISRNEQTQSYVSYALDLTQDCIFSPIKMAKHAFLDQSRQLMQVGGYIVDWKPATSDDDKIDYRIIKYDRDSSNPLAGESISYGQWSKEKFFSIYRSNFGASFEQLRLIGLPGYVLSIIPAAGRRSYQLWNFDPFADGDCLSGDEFNATVFNTGAFRDIAADRELHCIGNYVLDRKGANYKVWSFDPQSSPPLSLPAIQDGNWTNIDEKDVMVVFGDHVVTYKPDDTAAGCRVWQFDASQTNPLGQVPVKISPLPNGFNEHASLFGTVPATSIVKSDETKPGTLGFMRKEIEHVVYYMVESRSFDNVLGWLYKNGQRDGINWVGVDKDGFRGLDDTMSNPMPDGTLAYVSQYQDGKLSNDYVLGGPAQDPWHDNSDGIMQMFHGYQGYANKSKPTMTGFAWNQNSPSVLSSFTPEQLSVINGLAAHYGVSDDWFSSLPGGTDVNRGFSVSGSAYNRLGSWEGGTEYQEWPNSPHRQSIWKVLWNNGQKDWKIYYNILWQEAVFTYQLYLKKQIPEVDAAWAKALIETKSSSDLPNSQWISPMAQFYRDVKADNLPKFSYIEPAWVGDDCTSYHPGSDATGLLSLVPAERALNDIYQALSENKALWQKTLLVVTADKSGGLYDHVPPEYKAKPWPKDETDGFKFDLQGPRVPAVFASAWIQPNTVMRSDNGETFDSTSFAATLLDWYGIPRSTWGLGDRITSVPTIESIFNATKPRTQAPRLTVPYDKDHPKAD